MLAMAFHLLTTDSADGKKDEDVKNDRYLLLDPRLSLTFTMHSLLLR